MAPKYPQVTVQLVGYDGNAVAIVSRVKAALEAYGVAHHELRSFTEEAFSGDYDHLLQTCMRWVNVC